MQLMDELERRQQVVNHAPPIPPKMPNTTVIAIVVTVVGLLGLALGIFFIRRLRRSHKNPKYIPTSFLKRLWQKWEPEKHHYRIPDSEHLEPHRTQSSRPASSTTQPSSASNVTAPAPAANVTTTTAAVNRNTSVRSVMTLPAYNPAPSPNEQVLGREGERGGIDVVIEFPEGADEEEAQREAEMEALYQVRLARRRENEERDERRRLRREARERGDYVALRELQARARAASNTSSGPTIEEARAEHDRIKKERQRAISSVSYGDLGVARHDGTRLRANSNDSEREGLLGDAASMASSHYHRRDRSVSSILSVDTMDLPSAGLTRSRANSRPERPETPLRNISSYSPQEGTSGNEGRAGSSPEIIEHEDFPPNSPPGYENISLDTPHEGRMEPPPDYSSPVVGRGEHRSPFEQTATAMSIEPTRPTIATVDASGVRRTSPNHVAELITDMRSNSSSSTSTRRGLVGSPHLPSLRLGSLPSIQVDPSSPTTGHETERFPDM